MVSDSEIDRLIEGQTDKYNDRDREGLMYEQKEKQRITQTDKEVNRQIGRQIWRVKDSLIRKEKGYI